MGMFDYVDFECELPNGLGRVESWQTKDFGCDLHTYTVTKDGKLIHHDQRMELVPEEERPFWEKPEWESKHFFRMIGCMKSIPDGDKVIDYHGDFYVVGGKWDSEYIEMRVRFTHGKMEEITIVNNNRKQPNV